MALMGRVIGLPEAKRRLTLTPRPLYLARLSTRAKRRASILRGQIVTAPQAPAPELVKVSSHRVACDGVGGALGHPRVWLEMGAAHEVDCPYCDRRFVLSDLYETPEDERLAPGVYEGAGGH
jgi:uncharacterized Zn-finger protein